MLEDIESYVDSMMSSQMSSKYRNEYTNKVEISEVKTHKVDEFIPADAECIRRIGYPLLWGLLPSDPCRPS